MYFFIFCCSTYIVCIWFDGRNTFLVLSSLYLVSLMWSIFTDSVYKSRCPWNVVCCAFHAFIFECVITSIYNLDGVRPVDNRPSTDKLHHLVRKKKKKKKWHVTCDTWHVTRDMWHMTCGTWHLTRDTFWGVNILSKFQLPSSYCLWFMILWRSGGKGSRTDSMNEWATRLFIEQPRLHRVC